MTDSGLFPAYFVSYVAPSPRFLDTARSRQIKLALSSSVNSDIHMTNQATFLYTFEKVLMLCKLPLPSSILERRDPFLKKLHIHHRNPQTVSLKRNFCIRSCRRTATIVRGRSNRVHRLAEYGERDCLITCESRASRRRRTRAWEAPAWAAWRRTRPTPDAP